MIRARLFSAVAALIVTIGVFFFVFPAPASASGQDMGSRRVRTSDLDLNTVEGQKRLRVRIRHAARAICGDYSLRGITWARRCAAQVEREAWAKVHARGLIPQVDQGVL